MVYFRRSRGYWNPGLAPLLCVRLVCSLENWGTLVYFFGLLILDSAETHQLSVELVFTILGVSG